MPPNLLLLLLTACIPVDPVETPTDAGETGETDDSPDTLPSCPDGTPGVAFDAVAEGADYDAVAGDFTVETLDGDWTLSANWTGCDSYIFVFYDADNPSLVNLLDPSHVRDWLETAPDSAQFFFASYERQDDAALADVEALRDTVEDKLDRLDEAEFDVEGLRSRIHYVVEGARQMGGPVDDVVASWEPLALGIDRFQTFREFGSLGDPNTGWEDIPLSFVNYEANYYDYEARLKARLDAQDATVVPVIQGRQADGWDIEITVPDGDFDTLEVDLQLQCGGHPDPSHCGEWDYLAYAILCDPGDDTTCVELGRFITSYARGGRWVVDVSTFLAGMEAGDTRRVYFASSYDYTTRMELRFSNQGKGARPASKEYLWSGGTFDANYNANHAPITFTPPDGTTRVEIMAVVTGHGFGSDRENCAEFCNHGHAFSVNGQGEHVKDFPDAGSPYGCADQILTDGVTPNQYGTWVFGRGGWCPGVGVTPYVVDITHEVTLGAENTLDYRVLLDGLEQAPEVTNYNFSARIDLASWLVYSQ